MGSLFDRSTRMLMQVKTIIVSLLRTTRQVLFVGVLFPWFVLPSPFATGLSRACTSEFDPFVSSPAIVISLDL